MPPDPTIQLPREQRAEVVADLSSEGMSTRAIGAAIGVDNATVHRDLGRVANATPEPAATTATITTKTKSTDETTVTEVVDTNTGEITSPSVTVGLDGKAYPRKPRPPQPNRKPLIDHPNWRKFQPRCYTRCYTTHKWAPNHTAKQRTHAA